MKQMNNINFSLFLNKPYHDVAEHKKMLLKSGDKQFRLNERFVKKKKDKNGKLVEVTGKEKYEALDNFDFSGINCTEITNKQKTNAEILFSKENVKELKFKPEWRLTLGLGGASVFDTDITLHHIYGVPYIPASSIKGVVRSYIIETVFNNDEEQAILSQCFCDIFGCAKEHEIHRKGQKKVKKLSYYGKNEPKKADRRGKITFFDALPTDSSQIHIRMDIMNVHYSDYYRSEKKDGKYKEGEVKPPADWSNPSIINFLTVKDTTFQFLLASKDKSLEDLKIKDKTIYKWLEEALENHGIGAKTAVGYGYMSKKQ